jgi:uncharacterized protein YfaS (alpha-2-macroglobulin family)
MAVNFARFAAITCSLGIAFSCLFISGCRPAESTGIPSNVEQYGAYIQAFTAGMISKVSPVKIRFAVPAVDSSNVGKAAIKNLFAITPSIAGTTFWEDEKTLVFQPEKPLPSNTAFTATIDLNRVFSGVPTALEPFTFGFRSREQGFSVEADGMSAADNANPLRQQVSGVLTTADVAAADALPEILTARQDGKVLPIQWTHSEDLTTHFFKIEEVVRSQKPSTVELSWSGKPLDIAMKGSKKLEIPAVGDFKVLQARVVQGTDPYLLLHFSDPVLSTQLLDGLIRLEGFSGECRFIIHGNQVRVYPAGMISGQYSVQIATGIRNAYGLTMSKPGLWRVEFENPEPAVRLVGNGVILPGAAYIPFPFEAIGLKAVEVEVFKIYHSNVLMFLQNNTLNQGDSYDLYRVGRIIMRKKIPLDLIQNQNLAWSRFHFDLAPMIEKDPKAIYQVRIGFQPEDVALPCGDAAAATDAEPLSTIHAALDEDGEIPTMMNNWYGPGGWYEGYSWEDRDNPCRPAYYNSERFVSRNVLASNIGIIAKSGKDNSLEIAVTDLRTAQPISGAKVDILDFQQQVLQTVQTDGKGLASAQPGRRAFFLVVAYQNQYGYLRLEQGRSLSVSRFDVAGEEPQKGLKGFLFAERGVWRPGDSIFLQFVLEDRSATLPANYPVQLEIFDPRGQLFHQRVSNTNVSGMYPLHFKTPVDALTGLWIARVKVGGSAFERPVRVETVKPNRLKINLNSENQSFYTQKGPVAFELLSTWLHGAPARDLRATVELQLRPLKTTFSAFQGFVFDEPDPNISNEMRNVFDGKLNQEGRANFSLDLGGLNPASSRLSAQFKTRVFEKGGDFSLHFAEYTCLPFSSFVGVRIPLDQEGQKRFASKSGVLYFAAADVNGRPLSGKKIQVTLYKTSSDWWWELGSDQVSRFSSALSMEPSHATELKTADNGKSQWKIALDNVGQYMVRVCDQEGGHCSADFFQVGNPWETDNDAESRREAAAMLAVSSSKSAYKTGEKIEITFPGADGGSALVSLENGTKVLNRFWVKTRKGDNAVSFTAAPEMTPNIYAHITLVQPHAQSANDLPMRLYGVANISVEHPDARLSPRISMPGTLKPEAEVLIEVSEQNGRPMAYTLALVDEGLLDLTRFRTPDPWASFYAREALGVATWDVYDDVLGAQAGLMGKMLHIGGDAAAVIGALPQAMRFKPVVRHLGPFFLEKGSKKGHVVAIPNYVGSMRVMVVAAHNGAYGTGEKTVPVKKPLMLLATAPRVLCPGESLKIPVNIFAMDKKVTDVTVTLSDPSGMLEFQGPVSQALKFSKPGDALVEFEVLVKNKVGPARFRLRAEGAGEVASQEIEIQVRNPNPMATAVYAETIGAGKTWENAFALQGMAGTNNAVLELSSLPPINLGKRLDYLLQYPYGCLEQTLSGGFPQLYLSRLIALDQKQKNQIADQIKTTILRLQKFQTASGGFAYWPGQATPEPWSSSYAGHFLLEAKALGYSIPESLLVNWLKYQKKAARVWDPRPAALGMAPSSSELDQAYRLYTLALGGTPELASMNRLREMPELALQARWSLAAAYAAAGKIETARVITQKLDQQIKPYTELSYTFGSALRDHAIILETLLLLNDRKQAANLLKYIAGELGSDSWYSTQSLAWALVAVGKFAGATGPNTTMQCTWSVAGQQAVDAGTSLPMMQIPIPLNGRGKTVKVRNTGKGIMFARLIVSGQPAVGDSRPVAADLKLSVNYKTMDGTPLQIDKLAQGTDFIAEVKVSHPGIRPFPYKELALAQIFPSGWEISNPRIQGEAAETATGFATYQDIRDDRVNTFFDLAQGETKVYRVLLHAAYCGRFFLPGASCEAMYDASVAARTQGKWVVVSPQEPL